MFRCSGVFGSWFWCVEEGEKEEESASKNMIEEHYEQKEERMFTEIMTLDRKLNAPTEGLS